MAIPEKITMLVARALPRHDTHTTLDAKRASPALDDYAAYLHFWRAIFTRRRAPSRPELLRRINAPAMRELDALDAHHHEMATSARAALLSRRTRKSHAADTLFLASLRRQTFLAAHFSGNCRAASTTSLPRWSPLGAQLSLFR